MRRCAWNRFGLLVALVAASTVQPWVSGSSHDLNGDAQVDILDMQSLVAALLREDKAASDLNGDGRVDVLDLHLFLSDEDSADTREKTLPESSPPAVSPVSVTVPGYPTVVARLCLGPSMADRGMNLSGPVADRFQHRPRNGVLRYLFRLTSQAPPHELWEHPV